MLHRSEEATQEVGQKYTMNTFDLGVCMKALPLVWRHPDKYQKHIIVPGPFHTEMNYIGMLTNHEAWSSRYVEILLEAGLAEKGCLKHILSGKAFAKAIICHKATVEALDRLLFDVFMEQTSTEIHPQALLDMILTCNRQSVDSALNVSQQIISSKCMRSSKSKFVRDILERLVDFGSRSWTKQS